MCSGPSIGPASGGMTSWGLIIEVACQQSTKSDVETQALGWLIGLMLAHKC